MKQLAFVLAYLAAIVVANLLTTADPRWAPINAFVLIGADLILRDRLDDEWRRHRLLKLGALIVAGSAIAYALNADAEKVAVASAVAFAAAFTTDTIVYAMLRGRPWLVRANGSNIPSSFVDSLVFPLLAFPGPLDGFLVATLFLMKLGGGAFWAWALQPRGER